jgi:hypothetical protein
MAVGDYTSAVAKLPIATQSAEPDSVTKASAPQTSVGVPWFPDCGDGDTTDREVKQLVVDARRREMTDQHVAMLELSRVVEFKLYESLDILAGEGKSAQKDDTNKSDTSDLTDEVFAELGRCDTRGLVSV